MKKILNQGDTATVLRVRLLLFLSRVDDSGFEGCIECPVELLQNHWYHHDTKSASKRWKKSNIHSHLCDRYLS